MLLNPTDIYLFKANIYLFNVINVILVFLL